MKEHLAKKVLLTKIKEEESFYRDLLLSYKCTNKQNTGKPAQQRLSEWLKWFGTNHFSNLFPRVTMD